jgi:biotin operon repressor
LSPGVERAYLVHHRHALVAIASGEVDEARRASLEADALLHESLAGLEAAEFQRAVDLVPAHREIVSAARRFAPEVIEVHLPRVDAPTGRTLEADDLQMVLWTVDHPDDARITPTVDRRRQRLLRLLAEADAAGAVASSASIADALGVSASTVRRDLAVLRDAGHDAITRGQRRRVS